MSLVALLLVVIAAVIHAVWNLMSKRAAEAGPAFLLANSVIGILAYGPALLWLMIGDPMPWSPSVVACIAASALVNLAYMLCLQRGYRVADFSVVYPVARGTGPMLATLAAVVLLGEALTGAGVLGLGAVVLGIGLISTQGDLTAFRRPGGWTGVGWGVATGALIAGYTVVDAWGVKALGIAPLALVWFSNVARLPLLASIALADRRRAWNLMKGRWWLAVGVGLLAPLSYFLILAALDMGAPVSVVAPMREMSMMVAALLGMVMLRERVGPGRLAGCAILILGVVLLGSASRAVV